MSKIELLEGDNREHLRRLIDEGVRVHSVVTDPPYGLTSIIKRFGKPGAAPAREDGNDGAFSRTGAGFMGQQWDGSGIERDPEFWRLVHDILLPGGFCVAFSGARTGHWQGVAMEQAGFIMHPMTGWVFGSGFPKARDAGEAGEKWAGWKFGAAALKPALEPIYLAQRPYSEKTGAANLLKHGVGAINIDGCRVTPTGERLGGGGEKSHTLGQFTNDGWRRPWMDDPDSAERFAAKVAANVEKASMMGRYPANLLHDGSDEVRALFRQSDDDTNTSAARFFNAFPIEPQAIYYHQKASTKDRVFQCIVCGEHGVGRKPSCECVDNQGRRKLRSHPTVKPIGLMRHLIRLVTPPGGTVLDPFAGTGTTGSAAREEGFDCILIEAQADYCADIRARLGLEQKEKSLSYTLDDLL